MKKPKKTKKGWDAKQASRNASREMLKLNPQLTRKDRRFVIMTLAREEYERDLVP